MTRQDIQNEVEAFRQALLAWDTRLCEKGLLRDVSVFLNQLHTEMYELRQDLIAKHGYRDAPGTEMKLIVP